MVELNILKWRASTRSIVRFKRMAMILFHFIHQNNIKTYICAQRFNCMCVRVSVPVTVPIVRWKEKIISIWWFVDDPYWCFGWNASLCVCVVPILRVRLTIDTESKKGDAGGHKNQMASDTYIWITISFSASNNKTTGHDWAPCINFRSIQAINDLPHLCSAIVHTRLCSSSQSLFICMK